LIYQSAPPTNRPKLERETGMNRLFANGTVNMAQSGKGPPLFLLHSLLSDRASFDAIVPQLSQSFRVIVPELPGFGGSQAVRAFSSEVDTGSREENASNEESRAPFRFYRNGKGSSGDLAAVADRMAEAVKDAAGGDDTIVLGNGYGGFVALQMAIRHSDIAKKLVLADCGAAFSEAGREAFRNMAAASKAKGLAAITDVAMRRLFAPEFQDAHLDLMQDRREAFLKTDPAVLQAACGQLAELDLRPELPKVKMPVLVLVGEHDEATPPPMSHELAALLPNPRLKILAGCAHVPQLQAPRVFLDAIANFL
jgi:3-oxoadipate enol-lactonase